MQLSTHFRLMAKYNCRLNTQIFQIVQQLPQTILMENKGAFFSSIAGTLNHLLVADLIWLARFSIHSEKYLSLKAIDDFPTPSTLDAIIYPDIESLFTARECLDKIIIEWTETELTDYDLSKHLTYRNTKGIQSRRNFSELLSHLFNHQTHHRGQVSTLLTQLNLDIGVTDFLVDIPDIYQGNLDI